MCLSTQSKRSISYTGCYSTKHKPAFQILVFRLKAGEWKRWSKKKIVDFELQYLENDKT